MRKRIELNENGIHDWANEQYSLYASTFIEREDHILRFYINHYGVYKVVTEEFVAYSNCKEDVLYRGTNIYLAIKAFEEAQ